MPSRPFPARTIVTSLTSNNHCGHCRKHPETPGLSQYKRFIKKSADIHTYQRDAPPHLVVDAVELLFVQPRINDANLLAKTINKQFIAIVDPSILRNFGRQLSGDDLRPAKDAQ